jgi:hypothetical protein
MLRGVRPEPLVSYKACPEYISGVANREVRTEDYLRLNKEQIPTTKLVTDPSINSE